MLGAPPPRGARRPSCHERRLLQRQHRQHHAERRLLPLLPLRGVLPAAGAAMTWTAEGRFATMRSSQREQTREKKWASSALVVACKQAEVERG